MNIHTVAGFDFPKIDQLEQTAAQKDAPLFVEGGRQAVARRNCLLCTG